MREVEARERALRWHRDCSADPECRRERAEARRERSKECTADPECRSDRAAKLNTWRRESGRTKSDQRGRPRKHAEPKRDRSEYWRDRSRKRRAALSSAERVLENVQRRARRLGLPFDLDAGYIEGLFPRDGRCPVLGFRLVWDGDVGLAPSLDRLDPEAGYVRGNVRVISTRANTIKANAGASELRRVAEYVDRTREETR